MKTWAMAVAVLGLLTVADVASAKHRTRCAPICASMAYYAPVEVNCGYRYVTTYQDVTRTLCDYVPVTTTRDVTQTVVTPVRKTVPMTQTYYEDVLENVPMTRTVYRCVPEVRKQQVAVWRPITKNVEQTYQVCVPVTKVVKQAYQVCVPVTRAVEQTYYATVYDRVAVQKTGYTTCFVPSVSMAAPRYGCQPCCGSFTTCYTPVATPFTYTAYQCVPRVVAHKQTVNVVDYQYQTRTQDVSVVENTFRTVKQVVPVTTYQTVMVNQDVTYNVMKPFVENFTVQRCRTVARSRNVNVEQIEYRTSLKTTKVPITTYQMRTRTIVEKVAVTTCIPMAAAPCGPTFVPAPYCY